MRGIVTKLEGAVGEAHGEIEDLADEVRRLGERHTADHDVLHVTRTLGRLLDDAAAALAGHVGESTREPDHDRSGGPLAPLREKASELLGSRPAAGALLLADLRRLLDGCGHASVTCVLVAQGAQAARDDALLAAVGSAHEGVLRTHRWALTRLKVTAPHVLTGG